MARVMTLGTFDLPHPGHIALFRECRKLAGEDGKVIVAVNRDQFVKQFKGRAPVMSFDERFEVIAAIRYVDDVVDNNGTDQAALIELMKPDWLAIGVDWANRDYYGQLGISPEWLAQRHISLAYLAHECSATVSTTRLRSRLSEVGA